MNEIKALTFDTGGTILDWHTGFLNAFKIAGNEHGIDKDWKHCVLAELPIQGDDE